MADTGETRAIDWEQCPIGSRIEATQEAQTEHLRQIRTAQSDMASDIRQLLLTEARQNGAVKAGIAAGKALRIFLLAGGGAVAWLIGYVIG